MGFDSKNKLDLKQDLDTSLKKEIVRSGEYHPGEKIIYSMLITWPEDASNLITTLFSWSGYNQSQKADIIDLFGRAVYELDQTPSWIYDLLKPLLKDSSVQIRDNVICILENLGETESFAKEVLTNHEDPEPWLNDYVRRVVSGL